MKKQSRFSCLLFLPILLVMMMLTACGRDTLHEGECECVISFVNIPKEFSMLEENLQEQFTIYVSLTNPATEKRYSVHLTKEDGFSETIHLHAGTYLVSTYASDRSNVGIEVAADRESIVLSPDTTSAIQINVANSREFTQHWMDTQPMPEILLADKFSRQIQIDRKVLPIGDILPYLDLENADEVPAYSKTELTDTERGITVSLLNATDSTASYTDCQVLSIRVCRNSLVFPEGVTLGMAAQTICGGDKSLYGTPDAFTGSLLYGWQLDGTNAVYYDAASGDRITLEFSDSRDAVIAIKYELAAYED